MIIEIHINDEDINKVSGQLAGRLVIQDIKEHPAWFIQHADTIQVTGAFGRYSEELLTQDN
jgi:hypothetical protein